MSPQAGWILQEEVVPRLKSCIRSVHCVGAEDAEELVQDATCMAANLMHRGEQTGKSVTPGNIAHYTLLHLKSGRRSHGTSTADALGIGTQLHGRATLHSLDEPAAMDEATGAEIFTVGDVFSNDQEDPATIAARKMDWQTLLARLPARERAIVVFLLEGRTVSEVAVAFRLSRSTLQTSKNRLADLILEFMGADILIEVRRRPGWRNDLNTTREKMACRHDRRN
jgi:DNA-directed RNA polymerase specialized sigma24 family protein